MITEQVKNWIKAQAPEFANCIRLGAVDANAEKFLGVYPGNPTGRTHIALGGADCTKYGTFYARLLLRWGKSQVTAEKQAQALWKLFYALQTPIWTVRQFPLLIPPLALCLWDGAEMAYLSTLSILLSPI